MSQFSQSGFLMAKIHQITGRIFTKLLKDFNVQINPAQGRIMFVLWHNDEIPIIELAKKTALKKSTLTSMLDRLEEQGYILRVPSKEDRRKILIKRTEKDKAFQQLYLNVSEEMIRIYYQGFSKREIEQYEDSLNRIFTNVTEYENAMVSDNSASAVTTPEN